VTIAVATRVGDAARLLHQHIAFHLAAGADVVLVSGAPDDGELEGWETSGHVRRVDDANHTELARVAVAEHGADWIVPSAAEEFWWPRAESLADVLAVIPPRYGVVQALVRTFVADESESAVSPTESTVRTSLHGPPGTGDHALGELLRPVYRAEPDMVIDPEDWTLRGRRVPLRAWYPLEVLRFPQSARVAPAKVEDGLADGTLVADTRLRELLRDLDLTPGGSRADGISFPVPSIVDDASYAVECAAVGEVDLEGLDRQIRELELRIAALEARFWPTVRRGLRRLARRPG
jgi:hypothetical protein